MIGYDCFEYRGFVWRRLHQTLVPLTMPHVDPELTIDQAKQLLSENRALLIRWDSEFDQRSNGEWWHVIKDSPEDLSTLKPNVRYEIRRGLKSYDIWKCERNTILVEGYTVYRLAYERYETFEQMFSEQEFKAAINNLPKETEFWVAADKATGELVGFSENLIRDGACFYVSMWFTPQSLKGYASCAMFHKMNAYYLNERGCRYVSDGSRSLSHKSNIHEFLQKKFGFRKAFSKVNIVCAPSVQVLVFIAYPFRHLFKRLDVGVGAKINVLLKLEGIRRACNGASYE